MLIREAAVAGQFYPGNAGELRKVVGSFLQKSEPLMDAKGIVVPHAGYVYSGSVTGKVLSSVRLHRKFIILGPNHTGRGPALANLASRRLAHAFGHDGCRCGNEPPSDRGLP